MSKDIRPEVRSRGCRLKEDEVPTYIIEFIAGELSPVIESKIRDYLKKKCNIVDRSNIKKHLKELLSSQYIDKIPSDHCSDNIWDIRRIENLKRIHNRFPGIELQAYEKAINVIVSELVSGKYPYENENFRQQLSLSKSFFILCVTNDYKCLLNNAWKNYQFGEGFELYRHVKNCISRLTVDYITRHPDAKISEESFLKIYNEKPKETFAEISNELINDIGSLSILEALYYERFSSVTNLDNVFEACCHFDIVSGTATPEELEFLYRIKDQEAGLRDELDKDLRSTVDKMVQERRLSGTDIEMIFDVLDQKRKEYRNQY